MKEKRPATLYFYDGDFNIQKHKVTKECNPQIVYKWGDVDNFGHHHKDTYYRCQCERGDFHGHANLRPARELAARDLQSYIFKLQDKLSKLKM